MPGGPGRGAMLHETLKAKNPVATLEEPPRDRPPPVTLRDGYLLAPCRACRLEAAPQAGSTAALRTSKNCNSSAVSLHRPWITILLPTEASLH
jgi:hypothetical protein